MGISNKNIALGVVSSFMFVSLMGNAFISNVIHPRPSKLDLSAFVNLSNNIRSLSENKSNTEAKERLRIEEFAILGIERKLVLEIAKNRVVKNIKKENKIKVALVEKDKFEEEFKLTDEVKIAFSGLEKKKTEIKIEKINNENNETIPSIRNEIEENSFKPEKIAKLELSILNNLKDSYEESVAVNTEIKKENKPNEILIDEKEDDLVVFDYPEKKETEEKKFDKKLYERPISNSVRNVIKREISNNPVKVTPIRKETVIEDANNEESTIESVVSRVDAKNKSANEYSEVIDEKIEEQENEQIVYDYSAPRIDKKDAQSVANNFLNIEESKQVQIALKSVEINSLNKSTRNSIGFEFEPDYDRNERLYDNNSGKIEISFNSSQATNETTGVVFKQGFVPTRIELVNESHELLVPMFTEEGFEEKFGIDINNRNTILISRSEGIEDIEIDSEYSKKLLLDNKFNIVDKNPAFVLFTSVKTGNILIRYNHMGKTAQKIIFVGEGEMFFQSPRFEEGERESFELTTKNLLGNNEKSLEISNRDIKIFNTNNYSKKQALNVYELMMPKHVLGSRKYLEIKNQGNDVFVGVESAGKIQIPTKDYIGKILEHFKTSDLNDRCLVQFNFKSPVASFKIGGKNANGEMYTEILALDQEGNIVDNDYSSAEKIFVLGEMEGQLSIQTESENGIVTNSKSYCSNGTYLIEQH